MHAERERSWLRRWRFPWPRRQPAARTGDEPAAGSDQAARLLPGAVRARPAGRAGFPVNGDRSAGQRPIRLPFLQGVPVKGAARGGTSDPDGTFDWVRAVEQARRDWEQARLYFECVTDRDLVDQAIHLVLAAEKRYAYLLKQARQRGIQGLPAHPGDTAGRQVAP